MIALEEQGKPLAEVSLPELVKLCAIDDILFQKTFFPKTFRQESPPYARELSDLLNGRDRYLNIHIFRGGAKTSTLRAFAAKRIAYGISRTVLIIGKSENHALRTSRWLRLQIERNKLYAGVFGLAKGGKWQDHEFEVLHSTLEQPINVVAMGVTGSTRGVNIDDYRPDLIILDDIIDGENAATPDGRQKMEGLVYGALWESLAPASENPDSKLVSLATPQNIEDYTVKARKDPQWRSAVIPCFTPDSYNADPRTGEPVGKPIQDQRSIWEARWSSETLRSDKLATMARNQLSIWMREKECTLITSENAVFRGEWLKRFDILPEHMTHYLCIDPVPPPSPAQLAKGLADKDYEALAVVAKSSKGDFYVREIMVNRGHEPTWTIFAFFYLARKYRCRRVLVEQVAYQRTLAWLIRQAMQQQRMWFFIDEIPDSNRPKHTKIVDGLTGPAAEGHLYIPPDASPEGLLHSEGMAQFVSQFCSYRNVAHDDALESVANGVGALNGTLALNETDGIEEDEESGDYKANPPGIPGQTLAP